MTRLCRRIAGYVFKLLPVCKWLLLLVILILWCILLYILSNFHSNKTFNTILSGYCDVSTWHISFSSAYIIVIYVSYIIVPRCRKKKKPGNAFEGQEVFKTPVDLCFQVCLTEFSIFLHSFLWFQLTSICLSSLVHLSPFPLHPALHLFLYQSGNLSPSVLHFIVCFHHFDGANEARLD